MCEEGKLLCRPQRFIHNHGLLAGMTLGLISNRGRSTIMNYAVETTYSVVALGLMSTVGGLRTFNDDRLVFFRESAAGLNRCGVCDVCVWGGVSWPRCSYFRKLAIGLNRCIGLMFRGK